MMHIVISTEVNGFYLDLIDHFDENLFRFLLPKILPVRLIEFGGSKKGDKVHLRFLGLIQADWISRIVEHGVNDNEAYFVDEGVSVPFGITKWRHRHVVRHLSQEKSFIIDDIHFAGQNRFMTFLLYPILYLSFLPRKSLYKKYFRRV